MFADYLTSVYSDIFSFYKEELDGERDNYVHDRAIVTGRPVAEILPLIADELVEAVDRTRILLRGDREREAWERFMSGFAAFHYFSSRYRLTELIQLHTDA